jgi:hypothetical protein
MDIYGFHKAVGDARVLTQCCSEYRSTQFFSFALIVRYLDRTYGSIAPFCYCWELAVLNVPVLEAEIGGNCVICYHYVMQYFMLLVHLYVVDADSQYRKIVHHAADLYDPNNVAS